MKDPGSYGDAVGRLSHEIALGKEGLELMGSSGKASGCGFCLGSSSLRPSCCPLLGPGCGLPLLFPSKRTLLSILYYLWAQHRINPKCLAIHLSLKSTVPSFGPTEDSISSDPVTNSGQ